MLNRSLLVARLVEVMGMPPASNQIAAQRLASVYSAYASTGGDGAGGLVQGASAKVPALAQAFCVTFGSSSSPQTTGQQLANGLSAFCLGLPVVGGPFPGTIVSALPAAFVGPYLAMASRLNSGGQMSNQDVANAWADVFQAFTTAIMVAYPTATPPVVLPLV